MGADVCEADNKDLQRPEVAEACRPSMVGIAMRSVR